VHSVTTAAAGRVAARPEGHGGDPDERRARRKRVAPSTIGPRLAVPALAVALLAAWLIVDPRTPDLAAATYRATLFGESGFAVWDEHWYGGHDLPGYSLLFGPLGWLLGLRLVGALAALCSTLLFERLVVGRFGPRARWAAAWFAVAAVGDVWLGRVAFALGVPFALAAMLLFVRGRIRAAALLAALSAAASPVAGALLALAGVTPALRSPRRAWRAPLALSLPPLAIVLALAALFPEGGFEPFPLRSFIAAAAVAVAFLLALPREQRLLRDGGGLYLLVCVACVAIRSPVGSNVERYAVLLAGPLLICAHIGREGGRVRAIGARGRIARGAPALVPALALAVTAVWVLWGPVRETAAVAGSEATSAAYYVPVERYLESVREPVRVEVPLTRSHWEAALLAPRFSLARGWEKQLDERYDGVLLGAALDAGSYRAWLRAQAVSYVALPDAKLDPSSAREGSLVRAGLPYLRQVFASTHWRVYRVLEATPLVTGPASLRTLSHDAFALDVRSPAAVTVRVRWTRYLVPVQGDACVLRAPQGWTLVQARRAGTVRVAARFSLARAFSSGRACAGA
jgi:hypothetical protein